MQYHADGTVSYHTYVGGTPYLHFMLTDSAGASRWVYCVESGIAFNDSDSAYTGQAGSDSAYLSRLPAASQYGIKVASIYGWHPLSALPLSGINAHDWYMATQCIIWEYQQQLRSDPYSRHDNGIVGKDQFYSIISGRPAERAYVWILERIASHGTIPSFASADEGSAPVHELKWDTTDKVYRLVLTDTNNLNIDFERLVGSGVTVTRSANRYTFTSTSMIQEPRSFTFRKDIPIADRLLIWGRLGFQTMLTGADDPVRFSLRIKTETVGTARIVKTSEDGVVSNISFRITGKDVLGQSVDVTVITDDTGAVKREFLPGTYLVTEVAPKRYVTPAPQYVTIESGQTASIFFSNVLKKFRVHLIKADADTGTAQGDGSLAGARYGLYRSGELTDIYTTDANGEFITCYYVCGDEWTLREISPSEGYLLDEKVHAIGAAAELYQVQSNTAESRVVERTISGQVRLIKHTDDFDSDIAEGEHSKDGNAGAVQQPEAGARFEVYLRSAGSFSAAKESERDILITDADGIAASKRLPYGRYIVHQTAAGVEGENKAFVPDFTVYISSDGQVLSYILNNDAITGYLRVEKRDAQSGKLIPVAGAGYKVRDLDSGQFVRQTITYPNPITIDTYYTFDTGWLMMPEALPKNTGGYELIEVQAPYGYVLDATPIAFRIDNAKATVTIAQADLPQKARISITKTGEVLSSVKINEGCYQPIYEVMGLPGATYDIIADEDITTGDGTVHFTKDSVVETITTQSDATATSSLLYLGKYRLLERTAPWGMVEDPEPVFVELTYKGQDVKVFSQSLALFDERQKVVLSLTKSMEADSLFGIGTNGEYQDVTFGLFSAFDLLAQDGSMIPADGLIETVSITPTDGDPGRFAAVFSTDLPFGSYYIKELSTSAEYILDSTEHLVVFAYQGQKVSTVEIVANDGADISNELIRGRIVGAKSGEDVSGGTDRALEGALIGLFFEGEEDFTEENALLSTVTDAEGNFGFDEVPFGHWVLREITAPLSYTQNGEYHHIYLVADGQESVVRMRDTLIRGSVQLVKTEVADTPDNSNPYLRRVAGAVFELYADSDGDETLGDADELLGTLEEVEAGLHQKTGLVFGGYFVKEKSAPDGGYILDEAAYYFSIEKDGQIVIIENGEYGGGFSNDAYRGSLRIIKDSSDNRRDGFAFEVKSTDGTYRETFTSGSTGVIDVAGLRIGTYIVTEIKNRASQDYIIPDNATVEITVGATVEVSFYNERTEDNETPEPKTPEQTTPATDKPVPKTSDDNRIVLWLVLAVAALLGVIISFVFVCRHKNRAALALLVCAIFLAADICMIAWEVTRYVQGAESYAALRDGAAASGDAAGLDDGTGGHTATDAEASLETQVLSDVDFKALSTTNPDVVGWIRCADTPLDYPIAQTTDNDYYLNHIFDGTPSKVGTPFLDFECTPDFSGRNSVVFAHNLLDGSMFSCLTGYENQDFFDAHPTMVLILPQTSYKIEVFAAFRAYPSEAESESSPWRIGFTTDADFATWLSQAQARSAIDTGVIFAPTDRVVTLSTCVSGSAQRFLVMGRLINH
jgi:SrtB family sortase